MRESQKKLLTPELALEDIVKLKTERYEAMPWLVFAVGFVAGLVCLTMFSSWVYAVVCFSVAVLGTYVVKLISKRTIAKCCERDADSIIIEADRCCDKSKEYESEAPDSYWVHLEKAGKVHALENMFVYGQTSLSYSHTKVGDVVYTAKFRHDEKFRLFYPASLFRIREMTEEDLLRENTECEVNLGKQLELVQTLIDQEPAPVLYLRQKKGRVFKPGEYMVPDDKNQYDLTVLEQLARVRFDGDLVAAMEYAQRYTESETLNQVVETFNEQEAQLFLKVLRCMVNLAVLRKV